MPAANEALQDIAEIINTRVPLTPEEKELADKLAPHFRSILKPEVRKELEVDYIKKQKDYEDVLGKASKDAVQAAIAEWKKEQEPLSEKDIGQLLTQEGILLFLSLSLLEKV